MAISSVLAAGAPQVFQDHLILIIALACLLAAMLVTRVVVKAMTRTVLLGVIAILLVGAYVERDELEECAVDCTCTLAGVDVEVPNCTPPGGRVTS